MSALKYWIWLSELRGFNCETAARLIHAFGSPEDVYNADPSSIRDSGFSESVVKALSMKNIDGAERVLERCERRSIQIITRQDAAFPERLKNIYDSPSVLYVKGTLPVIDDEAAVSVVGSRSMTVYGQMCATRLSYELAKAGALIVSGMAKGIDSAAHRGALKAGKPTVAVFGCGVDVVYPSENQYLYEDIIATGAVVSEYPPETRPDRAHFPARNRIISGLSVGVLIVEAPAGSGALITANLAAEQGRDVFAVPGNIDSPSSFGTNSLIRDGAMLASCGNDIIREYAAKFPHRLLSRINPPSEQLLKSGEKPVEKQKKSAETPLDDTDRRDEIVNILLKDFTKEQREIILVIEKTPSVADQIIEATQLPAPVVLSNLTMLEIDGIIERRPGDRFALVLKK